MDLPTVKSLFFLTVSKLDVKEALGHEPDISDHIL